MQNPLIGHSNLNSWRPHPQPSFTTELGIANAGAEFPLAPGMPPEPEESFSYVHKGYLLVFSLPRLVSHLGVSVR